MAGMWTRQVKGPCGTTYTYAIGTGLLGRAGEWLRAVPGVEREGKPRLGSTWGTLAVITNSTVRPLYADTVLRGLQQADPDSFVVEIPDGEPYKTLRTVQGIYDHLVAGHVDRSGGVVALGGGVVGDLAGFAAATYMRGVPLIQMPTTLLAMVDASIGGKVGVDLPQGKNLIGAFHQPCLVLADSSCLQTLPTAEYRAGLAEVVKAALIGDPPLLDSLQQRPPDASDPDALIDIISRAVTVKIDVVEEDPFEAGRRAVLNLGHTFAHALEVESNYAMRHGEAVAVGLVAAARLSQRLGYCHPDLSERIEALLSSLQLPVHQLAQGIAPERVIAAMGTDKKRAAGRIGFVLIRQPGDVFVSHNVPMDAIRDVLEGLLCSAS